MQVAVLGLGRFGMAVASELTRLGHEVLGVDQNERLVRESGDLVTHAVQADITDLDALKDLGLAHFDTVIVAVADDLEASILCTVTLKQLGVERVIAKAGTELHGVILERVGASRVVFPERETGVRLAHSFAAPGVRDYLDVAPGYGLARITVPAMWIGKSLGDSGLVRHYKVTPIVLHRRGKITLNPPPSELLQAGDGLIVAGLDEDLARLPAPEPERPVSDQAEQSSV
jgi:trk system potassium uptake protein TrkA